MKNQRTATILMVVTTLLFAAQVEAATATWTNTTTGLWTNNFNWNPPSGHPSAVGDNAFLTNSVAASYTNILDVSETVGRIACLSNLRQVGIGYQLYADTYNDIIPAGYIQETKQLTHYLNDNYAGVSQIILQGLVHFGGFVPNPRVFFCPSIKSTTFQFDTPDNP